MRMKRSVLPCLAMTLAGLGLGLGACSTERSASGEARSPDRSPCPPRAITLERHPEDSVSVSDACRLVDVAIHALGRAPAGSGLLPADTVQVTGALVGPLSEGAPGGGPVKPRWSIDLSLKDRPYDAVVLVDRTTGEASVHRSHKPGF
jgi:hypothetical protein